jgi:glycogenin glucosyltransferase
MISSKAYVRGANLLAATIKDTFNRQLLSDVTLIGLLLEGRHEVNAYSQEHAKHWSLRYEGLISAPDIKKVVPKFKDQFTKLALWSWVQFERVVYIDSDCIALGDLSPFLTQPKLPFAAVRDFEKGNIQQHFNMGVFSFKPDVCEYHRLLALKTSRTNYTMAFAEQAFLNAIYGKEYEEWPFVYNGNIAAAAQAPVFWREKFSKLRILHYTLIKPFEPLVTKQRFYAPLKAEVELWYRLEEKATKEALAGTAVKMSSL